MIQAVRNESRRAGFNICIPRGDTQLNDGTEQVILYCDKYGVKRRRTADCKERYSKKTDCKWRIKFQKRSGFKYYELLKCEINEHNHCLNPFMGGLKKEKRKYDFTEYEGEYTRKRKAEDKYKEYRGEGEGII